MGPLFIGLISMSLCLSLVTRASRPPAPARWRMADIVAPTITPAPVPAHNPHPADGDDPGPTTTPTTPAAAIAGPGDPTVTACKLVQGVGDPLGEPRFDGTWTRYSYGGTITESIKYFCPSDCQPDLILETLRIGGHGPVMPYSATLTVLADVTVTVGRCGLPWPTEAGDGDDDDDDSDGPTPTATHTTTATYSFIGPGFPIVEIARVSGTSTLARSTLAEWQA